MQKKNKVNIAILVDGSKETGLGHVYRSRSFADALQSSDIVFLTRSDHYVVDILDAAGFKTLLYKSVDELQGILKIIIPTHVVIDSQNFDASIIKQIRQSIGSTLIAFGIERDIAPLFDICIHVASEYYEGNKRFYDKESGTLYFKGPRYIFLRDEFLTNRNRWKGSGNFNRIMIMMGGADPDNLTVKVLQKLLPILSYELYVVTGAAYTYYEQLTNLAALCPENKIHFFSNLADPSEIMLSVDLLLCSPGNTLFEAYCLGLPVIAFFQNNSQRTDFKGLPYIYDFSEEQDLKDLITGFFKQLGKYTEFAKNTESGSGKAEILKEILNQ